MRRYPEGLDIDGPVQAEVLVVWLNSDHLELTGPCGAAPWLIELGETEHPMEIVEGIVRDVVGRPRLAHSTSWRRDRGAVILSFGVVIDPSCGWEATDDPDRAVDAAIEHGRRVHNMAATREVVLATAEWIEPSAVPGERT